MENLAQRLREVFSGDIAADPKTLDTYSHDTSIFEVKPQAIVYPKNSEDLGKLIKFVSENKQANPELSLTARCGGTDMGGGAVNDSIIVDFTRYFNHIKGFADHEVEVEPGV